MKQDSDNNKNNIKMNNIKMNTNNDKNNSNNNNNNNNSYSNHNPNKKRRSTFTVLFYVNRDKVKQNGLCPVMGRITIDTKVAKLSAKTDIDSTLWDTKTGRAIGKSNQSILVLSLIDRLTCLLYT